MHLRQHLIRIHVVIGALLLALALQTVWVNWREWQQSDDGLAALQQLRRVMRVAELASKERGPANGAMGAAGLPSAAALEKLAQARRQTDQALQAAGVAPASAAPGAAASAAALPSDHVAETTRSRLEAARDQLARGRSAVDRLASRPSNERESTAVQAAVDEMFGVVDRVDAATFLLIGRITQSSPQLSDLAASVVMSGILRERAGRLGSHFTASLAGRRALTDEERWRIEQARGGIEQLRRLLTLRTQNLSEEGRAGQALARMNAEYFGQAQQFIDQRISVGRAGPDVLDAAAFAARYVPLMESILAFRDAVQDAAEQQAADEAADSRRTFLAVLAGLAGTLLLLAGAVWWHSRRVVVPLVSITGALQAIVRGQPVPPMKPAGDIAELQELMRAAERLQELTRSQERMEIERQSLIDRLRDQSHTDFLTRLPNRRGLVAANEHQRRALIDGPGVRCLAIFDLDHFKAVNDRHGHEAGDLVLRTVAQTCSHLCRAGDVVARYGGEEFVLLMQRCQLEGGLQNAHRMLQGIRALRIALPGGGEITGLTASFGVTEVPPGETGLDPALARADAALYAAKREGRNQVRPALA